MCVTQFTGHFVIGCSVLRVVLVVSMNFGLFELVWLVVFDRDWVEILYWRVVFMCFVMCCR